MRSAAILVLLCTLSWIGFLVWVDHALDGSWLPVLEGRHGSVGERVSQGQVPSTTRAVDRNPRRVSRLGSGMVSGGGIMVPVEGVAPEQIQDTFGHPRGQGRRHEGIDILAPRHTPVLAADHGQVERLFDNRHGGISLYQVDSTGRHCYYYAHLQGYAPGLAEGQVVRRGDLLGFVGTSGNAPETVPHLHFAVYRLGPGAQCTAGLDGEPLDPLPLLAAR